MKRSFLAFFLVVVSAAVPLCAQAPYCAPVSAGNNCVPAGGAGENIGNVTILSINNTSGCVPNPSYEDFTLVPAPTLVWGTAYPISVTVADWFSATDTVRVFCDWNGDLDFLDAGESFAIPQVGAGPAYTPVLYSGFITAPTGAVPTTRMRVRMCYTTVAFDACTAYTWGAAEDYTINTIAPDFSGIGAAAPASTTPGGSTTLTVAFSSISPPSPPTGVTAAIDLSALGGSPSQTMYDDGATGGDVSAGDNVFTFAITTSGAQPYGVFNLNWSATDSIARATNGTIVFSVVPVNDDCTGALALVLGTNPSPGASGNFYSNAGGTTAAGWSTTCAGVAMTKDVWFTFTPATTAVYQIDTETPAGYANGSITDTVLEVYNTAACTPTLTTVACDDDAGITNGGLTSLLQTVLNAGTTYQIRVGAWTSAVVTSGTFYVNVTFITLPAANDTCATATPLVLGANPAPAASGNVFNNIGASSDSLGFPAACATILNEVWFSFTPAVSDTYVFDTNTPCGFTAGTMTNTTIALYDAAACATPAAALACDADSGIGSLSVLQAALTAGNAYYLRVGPTTAVSQTFYVNVRQGSLTANNECAGAVALSVGTNPAPGASCNRFDTSLATTSAGWPAACATINNDLWFSFTPASTGPYIIDTKNPCGYVAGTATDTTIAVYTSCVAGPPIACNGNAGNNSLSMVNPTLTMGVPYLIRVGNVTLNTGTGTFYLNVNPGTAIPANDLCASATPVVLGTNPAPAASCNAFTNEFATSDTLGYPAVCGTIVNDVWFAFTPVVGGDYRIDTETPAGFTTGTNTNSTLAVYPSCALGAALACDTDAGVTGTGLMSSVNANGLVGGTTYYIRVGSTATTTAGTFYLSINRIFSLSFTSPLGPGSIQADIVAGPPNGGYYMAVTLAAGAFPLGWLYGVDIPIAEAVSEIQTGFPFTGVLNATGDITIGPFPGLPSGGVLTVYAVAMGFSTPAIDFPIANTAPKSYVIP